MLKPTISFYTLGCRLNQSETAVLEHSVESDGFRLVKFEESADVVVINTCTVTEAADVDTRRLVHKVNRLNPEVKIALIGCQAQMDKDKLLKLPNVRWVIGNARKMELSVILRGTANDAPARVIASTISRKSFTMPLAGVDRRHRRINLKIQDGCDFFCSFCVIPYARGRARSREFKDILKEAKIFVEAGHKEVVVTGINVGTYSQKGYTFMDVLNALEQIKGLELIRISSIELTTIPVFLLKKMAQPQGAKICRHLHIPLQSGSNVILRMMKRRYTMEEFKEFINRAQDMVEKICIGTDIIVGFPGESQADFEQSVKALQEWPIDYCHVFSYSKRQMIPAQGRKLADKVSATVIGQRSHILRELSNRKRRVFYESFVNTRQTVLFENEKAGVCNGLTDNYVRVVVSSDRSLMNQLLSVRIEGVDKDMMFGTIID